MLQRLASGAVLSSIVLLSVLTLHAQESYSLQYTLEKGKTYRYLDLSTMKTTQEMMGQEMKISTVSRAVNRIVVDDVLSDGSMVLISSSDSSRLSMSSPRGDTTMVLSNIIGKRTKVTLGKLGKTSDRTVIDSVKMEGMVRGAQREAARFHRFSEKPVKPGESWKSNSVDTVDMMGGKTVNTSTLEYTLVGREQKLGRECLKITYVGNTSMNGKGRMMGSELFIEGTSKLSGVVYVDPARGINVYEEGKLESESTAAVTGQQNMTIPITQSAQTTRTLLSE
jgi:hypothetical protein